MLVSSHVYTILIKKNDMKKNKVGNILHAFIKSILHIFTEKLHSKLPSHLFIKDHGGLGGVSNNIA